MGGLISRNRNQYYSIGDKEMGSDTHLILTHGDCDGICSAALYKSTLRNKTKIFFTHPHGILNDLLEQLNKNSYETIVILDIALNETTWREIIMTLNNLSYETNIIYIDHHPLPDSYDNPQIKFKFICEVGRSTSELTYTYLEKKIDRWMSRVALYGAIGDYSDETPFMRKMYNMWDKRLIYLEGGILTQALEGSRREYNYKRRIIDILSRNELPSNYKWIWGRAIETAIKEDELREEVAKKVKNIGRINYVVDVQGSIGRAARYAMIIGGGIIGIAIEKRSGLAIMSVRTFRDGPNLNKLLRKIAPLYGGSGGGHHHAAGARIPLTKLKKFLEHLDKAIKEA